MIRLGLLGCPVDHSLSPVIHRLFLKHFGLTGEYSLMSTPPEGLSMMLEKLAEEGYSGVNVTVPHKMKAALLCSELSPEARETRAVNTISITPGEELKGFNTDVQGFRALSAGFDRPFLVVGKGGAAAAVRAAVGEVIQVSGREPEPPAELPARGTVVNATPLGWRNDDRFPLELPRGWRFIDLNYNPGWKWRNGLEAGVAATGEIMLVEQAACAFAIWTGREPGEDLKNEAVRAVRRRFHG